MKIYFNDLLVEKNRIIDDQWVKGNSGNKLEVYFEDNILESSATNVRAVIEWSDGSTTNELVLNKSIKRDFAYLNLPILKTDGEVKFTLKIYSNDSLQQTTLFSRKVYDSINASDEIHITSSEYESLLEAIESAGVDVDDQVKKNTDNISYILETYERGGIKYVHKIFAEDEIIDLFNINGNGKYSIKSALYGDEIVIVNVENQYVSRFNGNATLTYDFEKNEWVKQTGSIESEGNTDFELIKNKITRWESLANDNQYPSASLVKSGLDSKLDKEQGNDNSFKVAVTNRFGNVYFENKLPKVNMPEIEADDLPEIPKDKLPEITVDMLPSGAGIITEVAESLRADNGNITGNEIKNKLQTLDDMTAIVECKHAIEITGNTGDEHGLAIEDQQVLIKKIQGQSIKDDDVSLIHSKCNLISTGRNLWDEQWQLGFYNINNGEYVLSNDYICSKNYINIVPNTTYYLKVPNPYGLTMLWYDANKNYISYNSSSNSTVISPLNARYGMIYINNSAYGNTYNNDVCVNVSDSSFDGTYEPYKEEVFVVNEELKAFDYIQSDKLVKASVVVDLGSLEWSLSNSDDGKTYWYTRDLQANIEINYNEPSLITEKYRTHGWYGSEYGDITMNGEGIVVVRSADTVNKPSGMLCYKTKTPTITDIDLPSGYAVYKGGYQIQDGEVPYILTKEYSMSLKAQVLANIEIDREQQEQLNELKEEINEAVSTADSAYDLADEALEKTRVNAQGLDYLENAINLEKERITNLESKVNLIPQNDYGIINVNANTEYYYTVNLGQFKYWKAVIDNVLFDVGDNEIKISLNCFDNSTGEAKDISILTKYCILEYINGCLIITEQFPYTFDDGEKYRSYILNYREINISYVNPLHAQDGFSIYWKGERI